MVKQYLKYISNIKRYSPRTCTLYGDVLGEFFSFALEDKVASQTHAAQESVAKAQASQASQAPQASKAKTSGAAALPAITPQECRECLKPAMLRGFEVYLIEKKKLSPKTIGLYMSAMSGFCKWLISQDVLESNPVKLVSRPKVPKRLPQIIKREDIGSYIAETDSLVFEDVLTVPSKALYEKRLSRCVISLLYTTGIRRAELIALKRYNFYAGRNVLRVTGKGDKMREIPVPENMARELSLYLKAVDMIFPGIHSMASPMFITYSGKPIYAQYVERLVKKEILPYAKTSGKISPHVLRHSIATALLSDGAELMSIKEFLGHGSLAATQVYTHTSIARIQEVYEKAHPHAKD